MEKNKTIEDILIKYAEFLWDGLLHTEDLTHAIFYVLNATILGIWTISNQYLTSKTDKTLILLLSSGLALGGLYLIYKMQGANDEFHLIGNRIRKYFDLQDIQIQINDDELNIFPEEWEKYKKVEIKDFYLIKRKDIKPTGRYSWWCIYKWINFSTFVIGIVMTLNLYFPIFAREMI